MAKNIIDQEAVSFQTASGTGTGAGATSQANQLQGTATTRQTLTNDRQLVGQGRRQNNVAKHGCLVSAQRKRNFLAA